MLIIACCHRMKIKGQSIHRSLLSNEDLREYFPSIDFDQYLRDAQSKAETTKLCPSKDNDLSRQMNCLQERIDFITTEKSINTDERCPYFIQKRFLPLNDKEINEELQKLSEEFHWNEIKNSSDPSLNVTSIVDRRVTLSLLITKLMKMLFLSHRVRSRILHHHLPRTHFIIKTIIHWYSNRSMLLHLIFCKLALNFSLSINSSPISFKQVSICLISMKIQHPFLHYSMKFFSLIHHQYIQLKIIRIIQL